MAGALKKWAARKDFFMLCLVFLTIPVFAHAGGLGIAAIVALCGFATLIGFPPSVSEINARIPTPVRVLFVFLLWGLLSSFWSPYHDDRVLTNAVKICLGVPSFIVTAYLIKATIVDARKRKILLGILVVMTFALSLSLLIDQLSGFAISLAVDPVDVGQDPNLRLGDMIQNTGHGTSVLSLLMVPVSVLLWMRGRFGKFAAGILVLLVLACAYTTNQTASFIAAIGGLVFMGLASFRPKFFVRCSFFVAGCTLFFAPVLAFISTRFSAELKDRLPFSSAERLENWSYLYAKILEHPIQGHGFDALRTFNETHTIRGFEGRAIVSLHAHNAGLHIWVELGFIGVVLGCIGLYLGAKHVTRPDYLTKLQLVALSGFVMAACIMASLSYGVWQDWWWASIIYTGALIAFIRYSKITT